MKIKLFGSVFAALFTGLLTLSFSTYSVATPFSITYTGTIGTPPGTLFPEVNEGESYSLTLVFDNGSVNALSQTWGEADLTCAIFLVNDAQDVQFAHDLTVTPEGYNRGEISTDGAGTLTSNFEGLYYTDITNAQYEAVGIQLTDPTAWFANDSNNVFMSDDTGFQFGDAAGGVEMAPANWSNPVSHAGTCGVTAPPVFQITPGLNDAWYYKPTDGQGFFITVFPVLGKVSLAWFTYDTEQPPEGSTANFGDPGHRWLTALGQYTDDQATMRITFASGGLFDTPAVDAPVTRIKDGTIILTFDGCNSGTAEYDIPSLGLSGVIPIERVVGDNIALCEALQPQ